MWSQDLLVMPETISDITLGAHTVRVIFYFRGIEGELYPCSSFHPTAHPPLTPQWKSMAKEGDHSVTWDFLLRHLCKELMVSGIYMILCIHVYDIKQLLLIFLGIKMVDAQEILADLSSFCSYQRVNKERGERLGKRN